VGDGKWKKGCSSAGTMSLLSREGVVALFDGEDVAGVPAPTSVAVQYGDPEVLREQEGGGDELLARQMMNYRNDMQNKMLDLVGGARRLRRKTRRHRRRSSRRQQGGARKTVQSRKNWLRVSASIRLRQQRRQ
jgi:hypothetical protein